MQDVNRLKIVLVEQKKTSKKNCARRTEENQQMAIRSIGGKSIYCLQMVYQFFSARY